MDFGVVERRVVVLVVLAAMVRVDFLASVADLVVEAVLVVFLVPLALLAAAVLVVREVLAQGFDQVLGEVSITGRLYPRQNVDRTFGQPGELSRIDPALVVSKENPFLYDGYIILRSEVNASNQVSNLTLVPSPQISERLPGFYWQHISYVVVWWFMGLLLLIAPIFPQFRLNAGKVGDGSDKRVNKPRKAGVKK